MSGRVLTLLLLGSLTAPAPALAAEAPWLEVAFPAGRIRVVTDASEKSGRKVAFQVAQFDRVLRKRFPWIKVDDRMELLVFASPDEALVRAMAPDTTDAEKDNAFSSYLVTPDRHVGTVRSDLSDPSDKERSPFRGFYRGRATILLEASLGEAPPAWLSRGLVAFLADTVVKDKEVLAGRMSTGDLAPAALQALPAAEFFESARPEDRNFDLQAGLFFQYLLSADKGRNAAPLEDLLRRIASADSAANVETALAKVKALHAGFSKYLASRKFTPLKLPTDRSLSTTALSARPLPRAEALMFRAEALFDLNRPVDTRFVLRQAMEADPTLPRPFEIEAVLFEREQRSNEATQAMEAAIRLGSKNASLYYRLAQMRWAPAMPKPALESALGLLEAARDLSPTDAGVLSYLAEVQGDLGQRDLALEHAKRGAAAASSEVYAHMALARAQWNAGETDEAMGTAREALKLAKLASQKQRVQEFLNFAARNKTAQARGTRPWTSQFGPPPSGAFGAIRAVGPAGRLVLGQSRTDSAEAVAITDCFAKREDAACARAVPALETACAQKQATSCVSLGSLYDGGFGVTRDRRKAALAYKTACDLGGKAGCARHAVLESQGFGVAQNVARATKTLEALCGEKVPEGCIGLAQILRVTGFAVDRDEANRLLKATCDEGSAEACAMLASR